MSKRGLIMDDPESDGLLFDSDDEEVIGDGWNPNCLIIPKRAETSEALNLIEEEYRVSEKPVITFEETEDDGQPAGCQ
jgi:hypothetical protein